MLLSRREEPLRAVADEIGGEFEVCDVSDREAVERVAGTVLARHQRVSLLVNNAGIPGRGGFLALEPERIEAVLRTNYVGGVWCLRAFLPGLRAAAPSHVVNVVSVAGVVAFAPSGPYSASKHAQLAFSRATAAELRADRISVHTILPGFVETEGFPQRTALRSPLFRRVVIGPERVADRIVSAIEGDRAEVYVPGWYRVFAIAPALVARLSRRFGYVRR